MKNSDARSMVGSAPRFSAPRPERHVLFLQGPAGPFFSRLGSVLAHRGHHVHRVNFNAGDRLNWRAPNAIDFRGPPSRWQSVCERLMRARTITDLVVFGDCRPLHRTAIAVARQLDVRVHVIEEGYLRPDWMTWEEGGVNGYSSLSRDSDWFRLEASRPHPVTLAPCIAASFARRAADDLSYQLTALAGAPAYPFYRTHRPWHPLVEYGGWAWRLCRRGGERRRSARAFKELLRRRRPYFLFPLQLDCDYQIRVHSRLGRLTPAIVDILTSFARSAPSGTLLAVKQHPLENGLRNWRLRVGRIAREIGIEDRIVFFETGSLASLVNGARGLVTVNSTSAMVALDQAVPVYALGTAVYDLPGLTHSGPLDSFWSTPTEPDMQLVRAFRTVLLRRCLLPGGLYSEQGLRLLVDGAVTRIEQQRPAQSACKPSCDSAPPSMSRFATAAAAG